MSDDKRENAERSRAEKKKRAPVAWNLDSQDGGGYVASLGAEPVVEDADGPVAALGKAEHCQFEGTPLDYPTLGTIGKCTLGDHKTVQPDPQADHV